MNQQLEQAAQKLKRTEEMLRQATKDAILGEEILRQATKDAILGGTREIPCQRPQSVVASMLRTRSFLTLW